MDSNHRTLARTDLQSVAFSHSATYPYLIVVLRPSELIKMKRVEKDTNKLQSIYDLGGSDSRKKLDKIKEYLNS